MSELDKKDGNMDNKNNINAQMPMFEMKAYGYDEESLKRRELMELDKDNFLKYLKTIKAYPFLAIMGLRVLVEVSLRDIMVKKNLIADAKEKVPFWKFVVLAKKRKIITNTQADILLDLAELMNIASHGYDVSEDLSNWALEAIPAFLEELSLE